MAPSTSPECFGSLQTEAPSPLAGAMDALDTLGLCASFNREEMRVAHAISPCLDSIASFVDELVPRLRAGGRLVYVGAGNSARVAFMDCAELPVTFSANPEQFLAVVAGGTGAVLEAVEGAEDLYDDGAARMNALDVGPKDTVLGVSASGRTPFVVAALEVAMRNSALTAAITNARPSRMLAIGVKYTISALVGPEFVAGSTRLKAGSSAKHMLNMISTCAMVKLGKTYRGLMVDVRVSNNKLRARGRAIVRQACDGRPLLRSLGPPGQTDVDEDAAIDALIEECGGSVKLACAVGLSGLATDAARAQLAAADGSLHVFVRNLASKPPSEARRRSQKQEYFLCVDGGGTNCTVSIASPTAIVAQAVAGPCNFTSLTLEEVVRQVKSAAVEAAARLPGEEHRHGSLPRFTKVWAGIAGVRHASHVDALTCRLEELLGVSSTDGSLRLTNDTSLLSSCIGIDGTVEGGIALIAGTGSVATAFRKTGTGEVVQAGRTGGWGHLVGDHGSAFYIGQRALQTVLASLEQSQGDAARPLSPFESAILTLLNCDRAELLSTVLCSDNQSPRLKIGHLAKVVTELGFRPVDPDPQAVAILDAAAGCLVRLIRPLATERICHPSKSLLILSGALMNLPAYRSLVLDKCAAENLAPFKRVVVIDDASVSGALYLAKTNTCTDVSLDKPEHGLQVSCLASIAADV